MGSRLFKCGLFVCMLFLQVVFSTAVLGAIDEKLPDMPSNGCAKTTHCHAGYINKRIETTVKVNMPMKLAYRARCSVFNGHTPLLAARYILMKFGVEDNEPRYGSTLWEFIDAISLDTKNSRIVVIYGTNNDTISSSIMSKQQVRSQIFWPHFGPGKTTQQSCNNFLTLSYLTIRDNVKRGKQAIYKYYGIQVYNGFTEVLYEKHRLKPFLRKYQFGKRD